MEFSRNGLIRITEFEFTAATALIKHVMNWYFRLLMGEQRSILPGGFGKEVFLLEFGDVHHFYDRTFLRG